MIIFLGAETYMQAGSCWAESYKMVSPCLKKLEDFSYGDSLKSIAIISIIFPDRYFDEGRIKERKLYKRKTCEADIRLKIDFKQFVRAKPEQRLDIYARHIIASVETLRKKVDKNYRFDELISDLHSLLDCFCTGE